MKRHFVLAGLLIWFLVPCARVAGQDDQYVQVFNRIQQADTQNRSGQLDQALAGYIEAQTALQGFHRTYPDWNPKVVNFRLDYLAARIAEVSAKVPAAPAPVRSGPANTPAPTATRPGGGTAGDLEQQMSALRGQVQQLQADKTLLEAKLKEAFAARPAATDPRELAKAGERIRSLQKENALLQVSLSQRQAGAAQAVDSQTRDRLVPASAAAAGAGAASLTLAEAERKLAEQSALTAKLQSENELLKKQTARFQSAGPARRAGEPDRQLAEAQARIAALESDKEILRQEKVALENRLAQTSSFQATNAVVLALAQPWDSAQVDRLKRERDELQKQLDTARSELRGKKGRGGTARIDELNDQLEVLHVRLGVVEAQRIPYTEDELALMRKPAAPSPAAEAVSGKKPLSALPAGAAALVAEAQRDFAAKRFAAAETKYLEVLQQDQTNAYTLANLAAIQLELGEFSEAEKRARQALAIAPDDAYSLSLLGNVLYRQKKYDEALDVLGRAAKLDPRSAQVQNCLGLVLSEKGLRGPAETALRKAIQLDPHYAAAHNNLAVIYLTQNPPLVELARWHYQKARAAGLPPNPDLEKMLDARQSAEGGP